MKETLQYLFQQKTLSRKDAENILTEIASEKFSDSEVASFLTVYMMRSITADELSGFRDALLKLCLKIDFSEFNTIDVCGTGGDEKNTFNISTLSAFVIAGAGEKVAKHGNYGVSSGCGSSNILNHFGYEFSNNEERLKIELETAGICYLHAPFFHPAMKSVGPIRKALKLKTFFNMLGPMVNPSFPQNQLVGVFNQEVLKLYNDVYSGTKKNYIIIYGLDGYDEISLTSDFKAESNNSSETLSPESLGLKAVKPEELYGGNTVDEAGKIFTDILEGKGSESQNNVVIANAGMGIKCIHPNLSIADSIAKARESLESGKALQSFKTLINK